MAASADAETLDPHATTALRASRYLAMMHDNLLNRDFDGSFKPALAESYTVSPDGLTYTFKLRTGVKFHSGKAFSSADVKYTFDRWLKNEKSPTRYTIQPITSVETPDPQTVVLKLDKPYNILLDQVAGSWAVILNGEAVDKAGANYGVTTVDGTGPASSGSSWSVTPTTPGAARSSRIRAHRTSTRSRRGSSPRTTRASPSSRRATSIS